MRTMKSQKFLPQTPGSAYYADKLSNCRPHFGVKEQGVVFTFCAVRDLGNSASLHFRSSCWETSLGWGHGSVGRVHALKAEDPESDSLEPTVKECRWSTLNNPSARGVERSLGIHWPASLIHLTVRDSVSKTRMDGPWERIPEVATTVHLQKHTHTSTHVYMGCCTHMYIHEYMTHTQVLTLELTWAHTWTHVYIGTHICTHVYMGWCAHMCTRVYEHMHRYIDTHRCTWVHTHEHMCTQVHTQEKSAGSDAPAACP